jgi:hypothetical protein
MLRQGSALWQLWLFGAITIPAGFALWHGQGVHFGLGRARGGVKPEVAYVSLVTCVSLAVLAFLVGG